MLEGSAIDRELLSRVQKSVASQVDRLCKSELEDFELEKSAEFSLGDSVGRCCVARSQLLLGCLLVAVEFLFMQDTRSAAPSTAATTTNIAGAAATEQPTESEVTLKIMRLFERINQLTLVLKEKGLLAFQLLKFLFLNLVKWLVHIFGLIGFV